MTGVALILCACERPQKSIQKAFKNRSKMGPKSIKKTMLEAMQKRVQFWGALRITKIYFLTILEANMAPQGSQNEPQNQ